VVLLIVVLVVLVGFLALVFRFVLSADENEDPAIGNNSPYPSSLSSDRPPYLPSPLVSEHQEALDAADRKLAAMQRQRRHRAAGSWMDVPGAMEAEGLFDEDIPARRPPREP
jgi:hypothetical protein